MEGIDIYVATNNSKIELDKSLLDYGDYLWTFREENRIVLERMKVSPTIWTAKYALGKLKDIETEYHVFRLEELGNGKGVLLAKRGTV